MNEQELLQILEKGEGQKIEFKEFSNPGGLPKGLSPDEFGKRSVLRNPRIAGMLLRADYIEKIGTVFGRCSGS